jgi:hypothetical protein
MISFRYGVLCLLVLFIILLLALKNYDVWTRPLGEIPEKVGTRRREPKVDSSISAGQKEKTTIQSYILVAQKNIFTPERKEFPISSLDQSKPMTRPQVILYGVTIAENFQAASVANPGRPLRKGERETMTLKIGDQIGEYKLTKISPDRITLEAAGDNFEVLLFDANAPKKRTVVRTQTKPATTTSTAPSSPSPQPPPAVAAPRAAPVAVPAKPGEPVKERVVEPPLPRPTVPVPGSDSGVWRGRRPIRPPYTPAPVRPSQPVVEPESKED